MADNNLDHVLLEKMTKQFEAKEARDKAELDRIRKFEEEERARVREGKPRLGYGVLYPTKSAGEEPTLEKLWKAFKLFYKGLTTQKAGETAAAGIRSGRKEGTVYEKRKPTSQQRETEKGIFNDPAGRGRFDVGRKFRAPSVE